MTETLRDAHVEVYKPGNEANAEFDLFVPGTDIAGVSFADRITRRKDTGSVTLHNDAGEYSTGDPRIDAGDMLRFYISLENDAYEFPDGEDSEAFGEGGFGGRRLRWTALVRDVAHDYQGPNASLLTLSCEDYVFGVLAMRRVYNAYENTDVAGHDEAILDEIVANNAPEIGRTKIRDVGETTSATFDGTDLLEAAVSLAKRGDAVMRAADTSLAFRAMSELAATPRMDLTGADVGWLTSTFDDTGVANRVRVDGGKDRAIDDEQLDQTGYQTITQSNRLAFRVSTRKANINRLEVWTRDLDNEEAVLVRLQKDDGSGTAPVAIDDDRSDIDKAELSHEFLSTDDLTTFIFGSNHTLPEPNPWVILETDGDAGVDIGVDTGETSANGSDARPAYKAWYEYTITVRQSAPDSVNQYRLREHRISKDNIQTLEEALAVAQEKIDHDSVPEQSVDAPAEALRAHELRAGDTVTLDFARERAVGTFILSERADEYDGMELHTDLTFSEVTSV